MRRRRSSGPAPEGPDLAAVYDRYAPRVLGYFRAQRMHDPEGLTGDVFVSIARTLGRFEGDEEALRRWIFTIAHNRRVDAIRRSQREPQLSTIEDADAVQASVEDDEPFDPELADVLSTLTDEQRQVVVLRHVADLSVADVAAVTGRSQGSVKMLTTRALDALAAALGDRDSAGSDEGTAEKSPPRP